jgi:hypothetical protein
MRSIYLLGAFVSSLLSAQPTQHHFHPDRVLSPALASDPADTAQAYLREHLKEIGIQPGALQTVYLHKRFRSAHNGVTHLTYRQSLHGAPAHNAEWVVNIDANGEIINTGGRLFDLPEPAAPTVAGAMKAAVVAAEAVNKPAAAGYHPFQTGEGFNGKSVMFHRGAFAADLEADFVWYGFRDTLRPAWKVSIVDTDQITRHSVIVDASGENVFDKQENTFHQSPKGLVYENNPITNPRPGYARDQPVQFLPRKLMPFTGDPIASPKGWLSGNETAGNNVIAGTNVVGAIAESASRTARCLPPPCALPRSISVFHSKLVRTLLHPRRSLRHPPLTFSTS